MLNTKSRMPVIAAALFLCLLAVCVASVYGVSQLPAFTLAPTGTPGAAAAAQPTQAATPPTGGGAVLTAQPPAVAPAPTGEQVLHVLGSDPPTLDPQLSGDSSSAEYIVEMFSGLVTFDRESKVVPDLAERWDVSQDGLTYTFYLRQDARFQDGKAVRAEDFQWSFERACDPQTKSFTADTYLGDIVGCKDKLAGKANQVAGVQVVDDRSLKLTIDQPKVYFLSKLTFPCAFVLDRQNVESGATWTNAPNGTGPFKLGEYVPGDHLVLVRNDNYTRDPKPLLQRLEFTLSGGVGMVNYEQGQLDMIPVDVSDMQRVTDPTNPLNKELDTVNSLGVFYVAFNVKQPPFDDVNVRQAFNYALDKERIINLVYMKTAPVAWGIIPPSMPGYTNPDLKPLKFDAAKAKQLIAQSKYKDVTNLPDITFNVLGAGGATARIIDAIVASYQRVLGIAVNIQQTDWATYLSDLNRPDNTNQMWGGQAGWIADYPDPHDFLDVLFRCNSAQNHSHYCNPDVDKLLDQAAVDKDATQREQLYRQVEQMVINDAPWVPLFFETEYWLVKPYVKNAFLPPMVMPKFQYYYMQH